MRIQKRTQRRTFLRPYRSLRSEWRVGTRLGRYVATELGLRATEPCACSFPTLRPSRVRACSLRYDRAVCVLGRYVVTELCNRFVALPFSAINRGVFCGFLENQFYPSEMFSENVFG
ncbi:hypothetical protein F2Q69_00021454 [Brassica cretica]|uniref:Uncharacterized protein n=1 Tax=Brassica cretica TaxID=69181 RepID=A0A8S9Q3J8_BRACR|nr:hypothetical protein F2Q69_00021454 [Brassica cretica]